MRFFARTFVAFLVTLLFAAIGFTLLTLATQLDRPLARLQRLDDTLSLCTNEAAVQPSAAFEQFLARTACLTELTLSVEKDTGQAQQQGILVHFRRCTGPTGERFVLRGALPGGLWGNLSLPLQRSLLVILIVGGVCFGLARTVSAPTLTLREAAHRVASGDFTVRVSGAKLFRKRRDELGELARDFDTMTTQLEAGRDSQRQLLADISHELRSPLARLSVALELARRKSSPEVAPSMDRIAREADRMNQLIGELLLLTRLESPSVPLPAAPFDLVTLVRELSSDADFEAQARGCHVAVHTSRIGLVLSGERELLHRAIENLLRNAVRYTAEGTSVELTLEKDATAALLHIRDHGPGVPEEALEQLFLPFWRVGTDRDRASGGSGLGLAIAERAVRLHGGTITAQNELGGGLCLTVTLPLPV